MWRENICPGTYTLAAQVIISFSLGVIFSGNNIMFLWLLLFLILYEALYYSVMANYQDRWSLLSRFLVVIAYIFGWYVGRFVHGLDMHIINEEEDRLRMGETHLLARNRAGIKKKVNN